jgi:hypothetical protein
MRGGTAMVTLENIGTITAQKGIAHTPSPRLRIAAIMMAVMFMVMAVKIAITIVLRALAPTITQIDIPIIMRIGFTIVPAIRCGNIGYSIISPMTVELVPSTLAGWMINW